MHGVVVVVLNAEGVEAEVGLVKGAVVGYGPVARGPVGLGLEEGRDELGGADDAVDFEDVGAWGRVWDDDDVATCVLGVAGPAHLDDRSW